jgi:phosphoribosylformylglycinamidine cyclo-ligase
VTPSKAAGDWTYARSGVDRTVVGASLAALLSQVKYRAPTTSGRVVDLPGHYAGLIRIGRETIAITTDTVGTKVLLAEQLRRWEGVGEDVVAVNVNDLAAVGARPCGLVDCISCDRPRPDVFAAIGRGIDRGLRGARCALLGGETAVVPDMVQGIDLGGTAIGFFPKSRRPVTGDRIRVGDVVLGIPSSGFHANGFTLIRHLVNSGAVDLRKPLATSSAPLGEELLAPTRLYVAASEAVSDDPATHGLAHISGGGVRNLVRLHPRVRFILDGWPRPEGVFAWAQTEGKISLEETYQTFNVGIGFAVIVGRPSAPRLLERLRKAGYRDARPVGRIGRGKGVELPHLGIEYSGYE